MMTAVSPPQLKNHVSLSPVKHTALPCVHLEQVLSELQHIFYYPPQAVIFTHED